MLKLDPTDIQKLVEILTPVMGDEYSRFALLTSAFGIDSTVDDLRLGRTPNLDLSSVLLKLANSNLLSNGEEALLVLLRYISSSKYRGIDSEQKKIVSALIQQIEDKVQQIEDKNEGATVQLNQQLPLLFQLIRIVVASPSDVKPERDLLPQIIEEINDDVAADRKLILRLARWETDAYPSFHLDGPQAVIDGVLKIEQCDILIGIFWKRFGTPTKDGLTGTEHEFITAYEAWKKKQSPQIMMYFNEQPYTPKSKKETEQWGQVLEFKQNFPQEGLWWAYSGAEEFRELVRKHLRKLIRDRYVGKH